MLAIPGLVSRSGAVPLPTLLGSQGPKAPNDVKEFFSESEKTTGPLRREDFWDVRPLGAGGFGEVKLVRCRRDQGLYALKVVRKAVLHERRLVGDPDAPTRCQTERDVGVLAQEGRLVCPFLLPLFAAFQNSEKLYFVYEYCAGGELMEIVARGQLPEPDARFYAAEVVLALRHLHAFEILHRDVRLENVLVTKRGHARLADFGCARRLDRPTEPGALVFDDPASPSASTGREPRKSLATPAFAVFEPPDARHQGSVHGKDFDCWQLGVMVFAMLRGEYPVDADEVWPGKLPKETSSAAVDFCEATLSQWREHRLGYPEGAPALQEHEFFAGLDWTACAQEQLPPPTTFDRPEDATGRHLRGSLQPGPGEGLFRLPKFSFSMPS